MSSETELEEIRQRKMAEMMDSTNASGNGNDGSPDSPVLLTDFNFDEIVSKYPKLVVDCWAPWCGPCRMLAPTLDAMAKDMKGKVVFAKLNTDDNFRTAGKFKIVSIPTLLFFKNGKLVDKLVGAAPRSVLEQNIRKTLG